MHRLAHSGRQQRSRECKLQAREGAEVGFSSWLPHQCCCLLLQLGLHHLHLCLLLARLQLQLKLGRLKASLACTQEFADNLGCATGGSFMLRGCMQMNFNMGIEQLR
jgi:hypothetical protein